MSEERQDRFPERELAGLLQGDIPCPDPEVLIRFHEHGLSLVEAERVRRHAATCGLCDLLLERVAAGAIAAVAPQPGAPPSPWKDADPRVTSRFEQFLASETVPASRIVRSRLAGWFWRPQIAYALFVVLALPAYIALLVLPHRMSPSDGRPATAPAAPPAALAPILILRAGTRGQSQPPENVLPLNGFSGETFILSALVPIDATRGYDVEISGPQGRISREPLSSRSSGYLNLACRRRNFPPGSYDLTVKERTGHGSFTYAFRIE